MTAWLAGNMVWASITMLIVLAIRRPVADWLGAGAAYALWLLPLFRLLLPPLPSIGAPLAPLIPQFDLTVSMQEAQATVAADGALVSWTTALIAVWLGGALVFGCWQWLSYRSFLARLSPSARGLGQHAGLALIECDAVEGPIAVGLLDRRIVVPADFSGRYSAEEQRLALEHEVVHHRRGDIWCNLAALAVLAANWFNPIAWVAFRAFRADQELACDAAVTGRAGPTARLDYANALVKSASRLSPITACPLNHADQLKRRLKMMKTHHNSRLRWLGGVTTVTLLAAASAMLGSPGFAHPHPEGDGERTARTERVIIMNHKAEGEVQADATHRTIIRRGANGEVVVPDCADGHATNVEEGADNQRTRIVLCTPNNVSAADRATRLQRVRDQLAQDSEMSAETRARVTAALDREIARLRAQ